MTEGPLLGKIILFVLPLMATNLLQVLYNAADMMVVSLSVEPDAVGAIGTTGSLISLILNIFIGFATGTNVVLAQRLGAKEDGEASRTVHTSLILSLILGGVAGTVGFIFARPILSLMGAEAKLLDLATTYIQIYCICIPFVSLTNYASAIFRAKGDTKTPMFVLSLAGIANVAMNLFFVLVCGLSVEGVALATGISNALSALVLLILLARDDGPCRFDFKRLGINKRAFLSILRIGFPAAIQGSLFSISNIVILSSVLRVNNMMAPIGAPYQPVVKANAAVGNLESFVYNATNSVYQAAMTFTSQNVGAGKYDRINRVLGCCLLVTSVIAIVLSGSVLLLNKPLLALYGVVDGVEGTCEHIAYNAAMTKLLCSTLPYILLAWMDVGCGMVRGLGKSVASTIICLIGSCLLRIVWIYTIFEYFKTLESIYLSYPVSWFLTALVLLVFSLVLTNKELKKRRAENGGEQRDTSDIAESVEA